MICDFNLHISAAYYNLDNQIYYCQLNKFEEKKLSEPIIIVFK